MLVVTKLSILPKLQKLNKYKAVISDKYINS